MKTILHTAGSRGKADYGWLKSYHTFSFANYYDPERVQFGALRVLNDDYVMGGEGFGTHPHDNMEIITIPLDGALEHKDSMGNSGVINAGEIQIMSAGTGITHSEFNHDPAHPVQFLQIWVLPNKQNIAPRYNQMNYSQELKPNEFLTLIAPTDSPAHLSIQQDAYFSLGKFTNDAKKEYSLQGSSHGLYVFVIEGEMTIGDKKLNKRDGLGILEFSTISMEIKKDSTILLMEVPMV